MQLATITRKIRLAPQKLYELRHPDEPWIAQGAIAFLDANLDRSGSGFEWGSGRSTRWFASRLAHLTSVENDPDWYERVSGLTADLTNVDLLLRPVETYVEAIDTVPDASLAFCLVDGARRRYCIAASMPKMAPGSLFALDNSNWVIAGHSLRESVTGWPVVHQSRNARTETTIWRVPEA